MKEALLTTLLTDIELSFPCIVDTNIKEVISINMYSERLLHDSRFNYIIVDNKEYPVFFRNKIDKNCREYYILSENVEIAKETGL